MTTAPAHSVLLIDDDTVFTATLGRSLQRKGLDIHTAHDPASAQQQLDERRYDLILLDLNLNGESGLKLLSHMLRQQPEARIVMLTAYSSVATAVEAIKRGADNYLCKPVNTSDILSLLNPEDDNTGPSEYLHASPLSIDRLEWEHVQRVLMEHEGNISATARALNMHRRTLQRKLQKRPVAK